MKTIWKYELQITDEQGVEMPFGAEILTVQEQFDKPCIWCLVDCDAKKALRKIRIVGTGHPIEPEFEGKYVGTFQVYGAGGVFHVFDCSY